MNRSNFQGSTTQTRYGASGIASLHFLIVGQRYSTNIVVICWLLLGTLAIRSMYL